VDARDAYACSRLTRWPGSRSAAYNGEAFRLTALAEGRSGFGHFRLTNVDWGLSLHFHIAPKADLKLEDLTGGPHHFCESLTVFPQKDFVRDGEHAGKQTRVQELDLG